ncbi:hypothetical protein EDC01DRAFT_634345 [Geopyxis carbonaria]|nr:hypothetical protein EDC01DRAFT_634345 [Geopyxis carbonaria]
MSTLTQELLRRVPQTSTRRPSASKTTSRTRRLLTSTTRSTTRRAPTTTTAPISTRKAFGPAANPITSSTTERLPSPTTSSTISSALNSRVTSTTSTPTPITTASTTSTWIPRPWRPTEYPEPGFVEGITILGIPAGLRSPPAFLECRPAKAGTGIWGLYMDPLMHGCLYLRIVMIMVVLVGVILGTLVGWRYSKVEARTKKQRKD